MLTSVAFGVHGPSHLPGAWIFVVVVLLVIGLIWVRVYGGRDGSGRQAGHSSRRRRAAQRSGHDSGHHPESETNHAHQSANHGHQGEHRGHETENYGHQSGNHGHQSGNHGHPSSDGHPTSNDGR
jgi:hypothetical protein